MVWNITTPNSTPSIPPFPPLTLIPPIAQQMIDGNSLPKPVVGEPDWVLIVCRIPQTPAITPAKTMQPHFTQRTFVPAIRLASGLMPTARIFRPFTVK